MTLLSDVTISDVDISSLPNPAPSIPTASKITDIFTKGGFDVINLVFVIIGLLFFANLIMSGWEYMMSSGDMKKIQAASTRLINGFIGLIMAVAAYVVVRLVTNVLGLGNLV